MTDPTMMMSPVGPEPVVFDRDGVAWANSRDVAVCFGKRHDHVLRDIDNLLKSLDSPKLGSGFFVETAAPDSQGIGRRTVDMTRDGFTLLAMGFTGTRALGFKLRYIEQFNRMEADLRRPPAGALAAEEVRRIAVAVADLKREVGELRAAQDPRVAVRDYISVRELLDEAKARPKGRNGLNRRVGNTLRSLALNEGISLRRCPRTGTWLFPIAVAQDTDGNKCSHRSAGFQPACGRDAALHEAVIGASVPALDAPARRRPGPGAQRRGPGPGRAQVPRSAPFLRSGGPGAGGGVVTEPMPPIDLPHLAGRLFGAPLMIAQPKLDTVLGVLRPRLFGGDRLDAAEATPEPAPYIVTPSGIAVLPVFGTLVNRTAGLAALSGLTSYQRLAGHLAQAAADPAVRGLLLDVDSSGGEAGGVFDLADQIAALRGVKPVYALAAEACFSAAYALACGAERLVLTRTAGVGSIGVVALHLDQSAADAQAGRHYEYVFAGARKVDGNPHAPLSDGARAALQGEVDRLQDLFVAHVARCRGLTEARVRDQQAALYFGANAVSAGLADQVGTLATVLADLGRRVGTRSSVTVPPKGPSMTDPSGATSPPAAGLEAELRQQLAAEITAATDPADELPAALESRLRAEAAEILELCQIGGCPGAAADFVRQGLSPAAVRKALLEGRAVQAEATAVFPVSPAAATGDNPLIAAIKASHASRKGA